MPDAVLLVLRLCLLALLYLFFLRVVRAVWVEVRSPAPAAEPRSSRRDRRAGRKASRREGKGSRPKGSAPHLEITEPAADRGRIYDLAGTEVSIGRAAACTVTVDDTFVSQLHARVYQHDGQIMVEDMGSTNGTYLNRRRVASPVVMHPGDSLQVGNTVLELR